ncbi:MAG TPA: type II secretion system F family protein [Bryobacteraceae bacterium]|nr:type II secretion system F family protein [Bryobacteraceae bacterium]
MPIVLACLIFVVIAIGASFLGMKLWVQPREAMDRVTGAVTIEHNEEPVHPSLIFRDMIRKLGTMVPVSPKDVTVMQRRLIRAGFRTPNALKILYGAKLSLGVLLPVITTLLILPGQADSSNKMLAILAAIVIGFFGPNEYVKMMGRKRQKQIRRGLANALDLLVVCVESGLGLDQAIVQVAKELEHAHPEICEEFSLVNLELKAGKRRAEALRNLADRSGVDDLKKLVAVLIQADRFGTGVAQSLRAHSDYMRVQARQTAEEKAAKLGVKLVFPIFFCILPSLFVVTVGPVVMRIIRELIPMMNNM